MTIHHSGPSLLCKGGGSSHHEASHVADLVLFLPGKVVVVFDVEDRREARCWAICSWMTA